jgi:hypothetical protein
MSKPREFAHLIKNKFGSADNINTLASKKASAFCLALQSSSPYLGPDFHRVSSGWQHSLSPVVLAVLAVLAVCSRFPGGGGSEDGSAFNLM